MTKSLPAAVGPNDLNMTNGTSRATVWLMSDIENSTLLYVRESEMPRMHARHNALLRAVFAANGGEIVHGGDDSDDPRQLRDDSFVVEFDDVSSALSAALDVQRAVESEPWPSLLPLRVRIGLHARTWSSYGAPSPYIHISHCSRICACGDGGMILVSAAAHDAFAPRMPDMANLEHVGMLSIGGTQGTEPVYRLRHPDLPNDPSPRLSLPPSNLPAEQKGFVGRENGVKAINGLIRTDRLVTLFGIGGIGKTSLALHVARANQGRYPGGTWLVDFSDVEARDVPGAVARALGGTPSEEDTKVDAIVERIGKAPTLLIADSCEPVAPACAKLVSTLLERCSGLQVLATSQHLLGLPEETAWRVSPLTVPEPADDSRLTALAGVESVRLFVSHAQRNWRGFRLTSDNAATIADICRKVDGQPLAIVLAASLAGSQTPDEIRTGLAASLQTGTATRTPRHARHRSIQATLDWSYALLAPAEQQLLERLTVFADGFTLTSAWAVSAEPGIDHVAFREQLEALVAKSMIVADFEVHAAARFHMLSTVHAYAAERFARRADRNEIQRRFAQYLLELALEAESHFEGPREGEWLDRIEAEHRNIRDAMHCTANGRSAATSLQIAAALRRYWHARAHLAEGLRHIETQLALCGSQVKDELRAVALRSAGYLAYYQGDMQAALRYAQASLGVTRAIGDELGTVRALSNIALAYDGIEDYELASQAYEESLALVRRLDNPRQLKIVLLNLGLLERGQNHSGRARKLLREALDLARELEDQVDEATCLLLLGLLDMDEGIPVRARQRLNDGLSLRREMKDSWGECEALIMLGCLDRREGVLGRARRALERAIELARELEDNWSLIDGLIELGHVHVAARDFAAAEECFDQARRTSLATDLNAKMAPAMHGLAVVALEHRALAEARVWLHESVARERRQSPPAKLVEMVDTVVCLAAAEGDIDLALNLAVSVDETRRRANRPSTRAEADRRARHLSAAGALPDSSEREQRTSSGHDRSWDIVLDQVQEYLASPERPTSPI